VADLIDEEPTRSVLHRSAASLAIKCGEYEEAERLIATALNGKPPDDIAAELRDLLKVVKKQGSKNNHALMTHSGKRPA
jgi:hypothetical protein